MHRQLMSDEEMQTWILKSFGAPIVDVELTCEHLGLAIEDAKRWLVAKKGVCRVLEVNVSESTSEITLPDDVERVVDVIFEGCGYIPFGTDPMFGYQYIDIDWFGGYSGETLGTVSTYHQLEQYSNTARNVFGTDYDWNQVGRTLHLFPSEFPAGRVRIEYTTSDFTIEQLPERDHDLLKRYALARAKGILGRILRKYTSGIPSAQGTTTLDGADLVSESKEEISSLNEEIIQAGYPMAIGLR